MKGKINAVQMVRMLKVQIGDSLKGVRHGWTSMDDGIEKLVFMLAQTTLILLQFQAWEK